MPLIPADERPHRPDTEALWAESWWFDAIAADAERGIVGVVVQLTVHPGRSVAWYWAAIAGQRQPLVTVIDHEVPLPRGGRLEIRTEGLWADHICETPFDHWTLGCEAFAVELEHPADALGALWGERVPFGLDLEWETDGNVVEHEEATAVEYRMPCRVHGEVLLGDARIDLDGQGARGHRWGPHDWWSAPWARPNVTFDPMDVAATMPVGVPSADGRVSELVRVLTRTSSADDPLAPSSYVWIETNRPRPERRS